jgi:hypothetical protein
MPIDHPGPPFIPGLELARGFYDEAVAPILAAEFAALAHSAGLIGTGSEVLGFDDETSTDHHWGPRLLIFLRAADRERVGRELRERLRECLPVSFRGWSTNFGLPVDGVTRLLEPIETGPVNHRVEITTPNLFFRRLLDWDVAGGIGVADWLTFPSQVLRSISAGALFRDDLGLADVRARLRWYPRDVWLYLLAAGWLRISQEEHLMGRAGSRGDELGSRLIAARLVRDLMRLCFLMEREYAPYAKWFGTAFARLACARGLTAELAGALAAPRWPEREESLARAYARVAALHNGLELTPPLAEAPSRFHGRPFRVIHGERFTAALLAELRDPEVARIAKPRAIGSLDQFSDSTDLASPHWRRRLARLFEDE